MICKHCNENVSKGKFCSNCGRKLQGDYANAFGTWEVTTEADCEGRTTKNLGIFTGYVDDIAKTLGGKGGYTLQFKHLAIPEVRTSPRRVNISFDIDSGTWSMAPTARAEWARKLFKDRPVKVEECNYYAGITLVF